MRQETHWTDLGVGLIGAAVIAALVIATLLFARVGELHGKKATLYFVASDASGVIKGTEIWLSGQKIGLVQDVHFRPVTADTSERLLITSEILADRLAPIRRDSRIEIKPGSSIIGAPVVFVTAGSLKSRGVQDGDTLRAIVSTKVADLGSDIGNAATAASSLATDIKQLVAKAGSPTGTVGAYRLGGMPGLTSASRQMSSLGGAMTGSRGTLALASRGNIGARVSRTMAGVDSVKALLSSNSGSFGRFRRDSTLMPAVGELMRQVDSLRAMVSNPVGTIGKAHTDSALIRALAASRASLDSLMKDIKSHPLRYIAF